MSGNNITITATDDTVLTGITTGYSSGGSCQRMQASAHVTIQVETLTATELPVNIKVGNIKWICKW